MNLTARDYVRDTDEPFWLNNVMWISLETGSIMGETGLQYRDFDLYLTINGEEWRLEN